MTKDFEYQGMSFSSFWDMVKRRKNDNAFLADTLYWVDGSRSSAHWSLCNKDALVYMPRKAYSYVEDGMIAFLCNILGSYSKSQTYVFWKRSVDDGSVNLDKYFQNTLNDIRAVNNPESMANLRKFLSEQSPKYKMALAKWCVVIQAAHPNSFSSTMYDALSRLHNGGNI